MKIYINGCSGVYPQQTFGFTGLYSAPEIFTSNRLYCNEPDYKGLIDPKLIRRMSRIIRMGVTSANQSLELAKLEMPDAIITGTAYGCLEDTVVFLKKMVENKEEMLSPAAFIQSTHNTVGAQIALLLKCHNYNNTFAQSGFSFENALLDSILLLKEMEAKNVLVGGIDEITDTSHSILSEFGIYKENPVSSNELYLYDSPGTINGEGSGYFVLSSEESDRNLACVEGLATIYNPESMEDARVSILEFLKVKNTKIQDLDLVITGRNGIDSEDEFFYYLDKEVFKETETINYKNLCGEFPTSVTFALWMGVQTLSYGFIPFQETKYESSRRKILIVNQYKGKYYSLILISAC